jgi:2-polyprenyl-6-methoxyphenol hydroxylase-like FAD-dependent oxidoreductase
MKIYGAGMAGLLAAVALKRFNPVVHETQSSLPNNHNAL